METIGLIIQSRLDSQRLPGKALMPIGDLPMIGHVIGRALMVEGVDVIVVGVPKEDLPAYQKLDMTVPVFKKVSWYGGPLENVLLRFYEISEAYGLQVIIRNTGDCPSCSPQEIERVLARYLAIPERNRSSVFVTNDTHISGVPDGFDVEVFSASWLERALNGPFFGSEIDRQYDYEHVTPYMKRHANTIVVKAEDVYPRVKLSVDTQEDLDRVRRVYAHLPPDDCSIAATIAAWEESEKAKNG